MTDLVERLRTAKRIDYVHVEGLTMLDNVQRVVYAEVADKLAQEAADEVERLRALLEKMAPAGCDCELCTQHRDEIKAVLGR